ncbi:abscisic acid-insensitive 5-like protein [Sesbania bispinosa]|nr:abscisic acid-insensitive 5-like protein [Sesbania bispinosa]
MQHPLALSKFLHSLLRSFIEDARRIGLPGPALVNGDLSIGYHASPLIQELILNPSNQTFPEKNVRRVEVEHIKLGKQQMQVAGIDSSVAVPQFPPQGQRIQYAQPQYQHPQQSLMGIYMPSKGVAHPLHMGAGASRARKQAYTNELEHKV